MLCTITDYLINIQCPSGFLISHFPWGHPFSLIITSVSPSFTGSSNFPSPGKFLLASPTPLPSAPGFNWKMRKAHCQYKLRNMQKGKKEKGEVCTPAQYSIERLEVFLIPLYVMIVHCRVTQSIIIYTRVQRGSVRLKCLTQSGGKLTNHKVTAPPKTTLAM